MRGGYGAAVRSAPTDDDGRTPLSAPGLRLHDRLAAVAARLDRVAARAGGDRRPSWRGCATAGRPGSGGDPRHLWSAIHPAYGRVEAAAAILENEAGPEAAAVERCHDASPAAMAASHAPGRAAPLAGTIDRFPGVTRSYRPGPFACSRVPRPPRTNDDLEHPFGAHCCHERRATGRKVVAAPALVLCGPVRLLAATATRLRPLRGRA